MTSLDDLDRQIILSLQRDGRLTNSELGRRLGVAEATVRRRIDRLLAEGIIHIAAVANPFKIGLPIVTLISIDVEPPRLAQVAQSLVAMKEVRYLGYSTGAHDIIIEALFPSNQALLRFLTERLAQIPGIRKTETSIQLDVLKRSYEWEIPPIEESTEAQTSVSPKRGARGYSRIAAARRPKS